MPGSVEDARFGGPLYAWWRGDPLPELPPLPGFRAARTDNIDNLSQLSGLDVRELEARIGSGDVPYVAWLEGEPVAYGWSARRRGKIGELVIEFEIPAGSRYLWDFVTLPAWRGKGVYPRLLQEILGVEGGEAERFWIGHHPENLASGRGISKAGFQVAGEVWVKAGRLVLVPRDDPERARAGASLLQIPLLADP